MVKNPILQYNNDLWKVMPHWLAPAWTKEFRKYFDAKRYIDLCVEAGFRVICPVLHHSDGFCQFPSEYKKIQPERDYFGEIVAEARRKELLIVPYYGVGLDREGGEENPDWNIINKDGTRYPGFGHDRGLTFNWICLNNPNYRAFILGQLRELVARYDIDGVWLDVFGFPSDIFACYCHHCRSKYCNFTGGESLWDAADRTKVRRWLNTCLAEFLTDIQQVIQSGRSRILIYNGAGRNPLLDKYVTSYSNEARFPLDEGLTARILAVRDKPFEICTSNCYGWLSWDFKPKNLLLLEAVTITAHGGAVMMGLDVTPSGNMFPESIKMLSHVGQYIRSREQYLVGARPIYDIALPVAGERDRTWCNALLGLHAAFGRPIIPEDMYNGDFKVLILTEDFNLTPEWEEFAVHFVEKGGALILSNLAISERLATVCGVEPVGTAPFDAAYIVKLDSRIAQGIISEPILCVGSPTRLRPKGAEVLAWLAYPIAPRTSATYIWTFPNPPQDTPSSDPAITWNRYGRGQIVFIATSILSGNHIYGRMLLGNLLNLLNPNPAALFNGPPGVEVVVCQQVDRHIVHVINHYAYSDQQACELDDKVVLSDICVHLNMNRIGQVTEAKLVSGEKIELIKRENWCTVVLPHLRLHEIILVTH